GSGVGAAKSERVRQTAQQRGGDARAGFLDEADDPAHAARPPQGTTAAANGSKEPAASVASLRGKPWYSIQACASRRSACLRTPRRNALSIPWRRNSHHNTMACDRQVSPGATRAAATRSRRAIALARGNS